jgi:hypothetical protein
VGTTPKKCLKSVVAEGGVADMGEVRKWPTEHTEHGEGKGGVRGVVRAVRDVAAAWREC